MGAMTPESNNYYDGSRMFLWLADSIGLPVDLVNFLISQFLALVLASLFRTALHRSRACAGKRHAFGLIVGLCFGYFCFGMQAIHIAGLPALCYIVIRTQNPHIMQRMVLGVALTYLSCVHMHRQYYDYGSYTLDITGPLMVITQKVTSLAFSIHDGLTREEKELTTNQRYHAVYHIPTALEYFSYTLHFQGLMAGPVVFYRDYMDFINGCCILKHAPGSNGALDNNLHSKDVVLEPSPIIVVVKKVVVSLLCALIYLNLIPSYPIDTVKEDRFLESSIVEKFWFLMVATMLVRLKYYHAWLMADAICNNSGLGFNGFDEKGQAKWDLISNINILKFEFGLSLRESIANWNMGTNRWLRMIVYERVNKYGTILTYALSALWHGFYPGYYLTFATGALFTLAARNMRRAFRHFFTESKYMKFFYDAMTFIATRIFMAYTTYTFVLLEFWAGVRLYLNMYLCLHIVGLLALTVVPKLTPMHKRSGDFTCIKVNGITGNGMKGPRVNGVVKNNIEKQHGE